MTDQHEPVACEEGRIRPVSQRKILLRLDLGTIEGGFRRIGEAARHRVAVVNCCVCFDRIVDLLVESRRSQPLVTAHIPFTTDVRVPTFTIIQETVAEDGKAWGREKGGKEGE